jgi:hypothetical protein
MTSLFRQFSTATLAVIIALAAPLLAQTAPTPAPPTGAITIPPLCEVISEYSPAHHSHIASYLSDPIEQLEKEVPELNGLKPDSTQDALTIAGRASAVNADMLPRVPNLLAQEQVFFNPNGDITVGNYEYRITPRHDPVHGLVFEESRLDEGKQASTIALPNTSDLHSSGAATEWLLFYPRNLRESAFRYIGQQKVDGHQTYLVAFAQLPSRTNYIMVIDTNGKSCSTLLQGVAWIDQSTFQIVRLQTDLLAPLAGDLNDKNDPPLVLSRRVLDFGKVNIPQRSLTLWLPKVTDITWQKGDRLNEERHEYSDYRLFDVTSTIIYGHSN